MVDRASRYIAHTLCLASMSRTLPSYVAYSHVATFTAVVWAHAFVGVFRATAGTVCHDRSPCSLAQDHTQAFCGKSEFLAFRCQHEAADTCTGKAICDDTCAAIAPRPWAIRSGNEVAAFWCRCLGQG